MELRRNYHPWPPITQISFLSTSLLHHRSSKHTRVGLPGPLSRRRWWRPPLQGCSQSLAGSGSNWLTARVWLASCQVWQDSLWNGSASLVYSERKKERNTLLFSCCAVHMVHLWDVLRQCLDPSNFQKFYKIPCHIESLDACMEY
jgi:hypothetical protein